MRTIRLRVNDKIYLTKELDEVEDGSAEYISIEQLDKLLEVTIRKYED